MKDMKREEKVKVIQKTLNFSKNDSEALMAQAEEVPTTDIIPLEELKENAQVDSTATQLNNQMATSTDILDRNV